MLLLFAAVVPDAHAECLSAPAAVVEMLPVDGTPAAPQSTSVGAFIENDPTAVQVVLTDADGAEIAGRRSVRSWEGPSLERATRHLVLITPTEELVEGENYTVTATLEDGETSVSNFTVGIAADIPPTPPRIALLSVRDSLGAGECDHPALRRFRAELTGLDDLWGGSGFVSLYSTYSGGGLDRLVGVVPAPPDGEYVAMEGIVTTSEEPAGPCLAAVAEGEARKPSETVLVCPPDNEALPGIYRGGAGCSASPKTAPTGFAALIALLATNFRRRQRR